MTSSQEIINVLLENDELSEQRIFVLEVSFYLGAIPTKITVRIHRALYLDESLGSQYEFELSHYIKTPLIATAYTPSSPYGPTPALALRQAISALADYYNQAIEAGHQPDVSWLHERTW